MAATYDFYMERAAEAAAAAAKATLDNVRERELRSEKTWLGLAKQAEAAAMQREKLQREKAEKLEAEQEATV